MKQKVYVETSVISYLTARASRDIIIVANQQATQEWWNERRGHFELYVSQLVVQEAVYGDAYAILACRLKGYEPPVICTPLELMEV